MSRPRHLVAMQNHRVEILNLVDSHQPATRLPRREPPFPAWLTAVSLRYITFHKRLQFPSAGRLIHTARPALISAMNSSTNLFLWRLVWLLTILAPTSLTIAAAPLRVMSYNIRYDNPQDGKNTWSNRRDAVATLIRDHDVDVIGMQEALATQIKDLTDRLPEYDWYGVGRDDGERLGEFCPIFFRQDRFNVAGTGTFWLCEEPQQAGRIDWGAGCPRIASWVALTDKRRDKQSLPIYFYNTHFDNRSVLARDRSAKLILARLSHLGEAPIVLTGDFNCRSDAPPIMHLTRRDANDVHLYDAFAIASSHHGPLSTWNGFGQITPGRRIDYVLLSQHWKVKSHQIIDRRTQNGFPSDHLPVLVELDEKQHRGN